MFQGFITPNKVIAEGFSFRFYVLLKKNRIKAIFPVLGVLSRIDFSTFIFKGFCIKQNSLLKL